MVYARYNELDNYIWYHEIGIVNGSGSDPLQEITHLGYPCKNHIFFAFHIAPRGQDFVFPRGWQISR